MIAHDRLSGNGPEVCLVNAMLNRRLRLRFTCGKCSPADSFFLVGLLHEFRLPFKPSERVGAGCRLRYDGTLSAVWQSVAGRPLESAVVHSDAGLALRGDHGFGVRHRASRREPGGTPG